MKKILFISILSLLVGCTSAPSMKEVEDKIKQEITTAIDTKLVASGTSVAEVHSALTTTMTRQDALALVKSVAADYLDTKGQQVVNQKLQEIETGLVSKTDLDANTKQQWTWVMGVIGTLIVSYLGKQVVSAGANGKRDARLDLIEKLIAGGVDLVEGDSGTTTTDNKPSTEAKPSA